LPATSITKRVSECRLNLSPARFNIMAGTLVTTDFVAGEENNVRRISQVVKDDSFRDSGVAASVDGGYDNVKERAGTPIGFQDIEWFFPVGQKAKWKMDVEGDGMWKEVA
jgi:hypothetical protein